MTLPTMQQFSSQGSYTYIGMAKASHSNQIWIPAACERCLYMIPTSTTVCSLPSLLWYNSNSLQKPEVAMHVATWVVLVLFPLYNLQSSSSPSRLLSAELKCTWTQQSIPFLFHSADRFRICTMCQYWKWLALWNRIWVWLASSPGPFRKSGRG